MVLVGVKEAQGTFEGNAYHNFNLHVTEENSKAIGILTKVLKVKAERSLEVFGQEMKFDDFAGYIGKDIEVYYDQYGNAGKVKFLA